MDSSSKIRQAFQRSFKALQLKPSLGRDTGIVKVRLGEGLACWAEAGPWKIKIDMPEAAGGDSSAPTPGFYGRAALGSCLAIGYLMRAAVMDIKILSLEVEVQADYDDGALFGTDTESPPGYTEVRYLVTLETDEEDSVVRRLLDEADRHSPYLDIFSRAQHCKREYRIVSPQKSN